MFTARPVQNPAVFSWDQAVTICLPWSRYGRRHSSSVARGLAHRRAEDRLVRRYCSLQCHHWLSRSFPWMDLNQDPGHNQQGPPGHWGSKAHARSVQGPPNTLPSRLCFPAIPRLQEWIQADGGRPRPPVRTEVSWQAKAGRVGKKVSKPDLKANPSLLPTSQRGNYATNRKRTQAPHRQVLSPLTDPSPALIPGSRQENDWTEKR
jgi:hypothetical protein